MAFTIIALILWQTGMYSTAEAAVVAAPPKPRYTVPSNPQVIWRFELVYLPMWKLEAVW